QLPRPPPALVLERRDVETGGGAFEFHRLARRKAHLCWHNGHRDFPRRRQPAAASRPHCGHHQYSAGAHGTTPLSFLLGWIPEKNPCPKLPPSHEARSFLELPRPTKRSN